MSQIKSSKYPIPGECIDIYENREINYLSNQYYRWHGSQQYPVIPLCVMAHVRRDQHWFRHLNYPHMALELICQGTMEYRTDQKVELATPGTLYVVSHHSNCYMVNHDGSSERRIILLLNGQSLDSIAAALHLDCDQLIKISDPVGLADQMLKLGEMLSDTSRGEEISIATYAILLRIARDIQPEPEILMPMLKVIHRNVAYPYTLSQMAEMCGISPATLQRYFVEYFKTSPYNYILQLRLKMACDLLKNQNIPIKTIALRSGFSSPRRLNSAFKKAYNMTPSEYRHPEKKHDC